MISNAYSSAGGGGGGKPPLLNKFKTCTNDDPTTTIKKNIIKVLETGYSSTLSSTLPNETFPRLVTFLSNLLLRLRILRGNGYIIVFELEQPLIDVDTLFELYSCVFGCGNRAGMDCVCVMLCSLVGETKMTRRSPRGRNIFGLTSMNNNISGRSSIEQVVVS